MLEFTLSHLSLIYLIGMVNSQLHHKILPDEERQEYSAEHVNLIVLELVVIDDGILI